MKNFFILEENCFFVLLYAFKKNINTNINLYNYEDFTH